MTTWFTVKVKYTKQLDDGRFKSVTEPYLVDAATFTDAEARIYESVGQYIRGEFIIKGISKTEYADVFYYEDSNDWYKCKLTYVAVEADASKEKKITNNFLITANSVKEAYSRLKESLSDMMVDFEIPSISLTPIAEVIPYEGGDEAEENQEINTFSAEEILEETEENQEINTFSMEGIKDISVKDTDEKSDVTVIDVNE